MVLSVAVEVISWNLVGALGSLPTITIKEGSCFCHGGSDRVKAMIEERKYERLELSGLRNRCKGLG